MRPSDVVIKRRGRRGRVPEAGSVFAFELESLGYMAMRVVEPRSALGSAFSHCCLIYVFRDLWPREPDVGQLDVGSHNVLLPPVLLSHLFFTQGWPVRLAKAGFSPGERFSAHVFERSRPPAIFDEFGNRLSAPRVGAALGEYALFFVPGLEELIAQRWPEVRQHVR